MPEAVTSGGRIWRNGIRARALAVPPGRSWVWCVQMSCPRADGCGRPGLHRPGRPAARPSHERLRPGGTAVSGYRRVWRGSEDILGRPGTGQHVVQCRMRAADDVQRRPVPGPPGLDMAPRPEHSSVPGRQSVGQHRIEAQRAVVVTTPRLADTPCASVRPRGRAAPRRTADRPDPTDAHSRRTHQPTQPSHPLDTRQGASVPIIGNGAVHPRRPGRGGTDSAEPRV
jgi:hypothetical protein